MNLIEAIKTDIIKTDKKKTSTTVDDKTKRKNEKIKKTEMQDELTGYHSSLIRTQLRK